MQIRNFTPTDYPSIVEIRKSMNIVYPETSGDVQAWIDADRNRSPKCKFQRFVAKEDGRVIAASSFGNRLDDFHPQKFYINIEVLEAFRNRGIGSAIYQRLMDEMQQYDPAILRTDILMNQIQSYPFVEKRGFREVWRETPVHLDLAGFDPAPFTALEAKSRQEGIVIKTLREIQSQPDYEHKVFDLYHEAARYVPCEFDELEIGSFEDWLSWCLNEPSTNPEAFFFALRDGQLIALHETGTYGNNPVLVGGLLGTLPEFRGKGIALALMIRAIQYGQSHGLTTFKTCTAKVNQPMQALLTKLGFARDPEWLQCQKDIK